MHNEGLIIYIIIIYIIIGHGPFSHMFEYGIYELLRLEYPDKFLIQNQEVTVPQEWEV